MSHPTPQAHYTLWQLILYFLKLGAIGFGGPCRPGRPSMHRDLVEERRWITESDYKEGLALSQIAPAAGGAIGDLSGLRALPRPWGHAGRAGLCAALVPDGAGPGLGLCALAACPGCSRCFMASVLP